MALEFARGTYPGREWRLSFGDFPAETEADLFMLPGNAELLTTAILNLLDNAGKYSAGPVRTELAYSDERTLRVRVQDEGPGLSPEELQKIFEPLYRATGALGRPGYGLGLPLTQRVVQRHGGRLEITSAPGRALPPRCGCRLRRCSKGRPRAGKGRRAFPRPALMFSHTLLIWFSCRAGSFVACFTWPRLPDHEHPQRTPLL
jgi:signal transduction histidine kinase